jgi:hypothetical protein
LKKALGRSVGRSVGRLVGTLPSQRGCSIGRVVFCIWGTDWLMLLKSFIEDLPITVTVKDVMAGRCTPPQDENVYPLLLLLFIEQLIIEPYHQPRERSHHVMEGFIPSVPTS